MKPIYWCFFISLFLQPVFTLKAQPLLNKYNVLWNSQSLNAAGSMPIGNGDIGANTWVNKNGELTILISKTDAFSEIGRILKIGQIGIKISPNLLDATNFTQRLNLQNGSIEIEARKGKDHVQLQCWVDANNPIIHIEGTSNIAIQVSVVNQWWRKESLPLINKERHSAYGISFGEKVYPKEKDTILNQPNYLVWCHQNKSSIWQTTLDNQNISEFNKFSSDPLLFQNFGALVGGNNFKSISDSSITNMQPSKDFKLKVVVLKNKTPDITIWKNKILQIYKANNTIASFDLHKKWWNNFWNKHYIIVSSTTDSINTYKITQGYILQRYINACAGRGGLPIKFNGSIFTVNLTENLGTGLKGFDADYRDWGGNYWFQNTRLPYWSMLYTGDFEQMKPLFKMYSEALALAKYRTKKYFNHNGAYFTETLTPWGSYLVDNYGWDRKDKPDGVSENKYIRYYWQSGIELSTMMLDYFEFTNDKNFFNKQFVPFAKEIIQFYDLHYPRDSSGKIKFTPAQSLESFFEGVVNPMPEIAGLKWLLESLNKYPTLIADKEFKQQFKRLLLELPELPLTTLDNKTMLAAGLNLGKRMNIEKPELYAVFPYRLFGVDKPNIQQAIDAYNNRSNKEFWGWQQDGIFAALLGLTEEAKKIVSINFSTKHNGSRFPAFWGPNYDWVPDQDHGNVNMRALQNMLVQTETDKTLLLPAWPANWNVSFKITIPGNKIVQGSYNEAQGVELISKNTQVKIMLPK